MPDVSACPERRRLEHLLLGQLAGPEAELLEQHVSNCSRCSALLGSLRPEDQLVQAMRSAGAEDITSEQRRADAYVPWLKRLRKGEDVTRTATISQNTESSQPSGTSSFDFLAPPQSDDELGRLGPYIIRRALGAGGMGMVFLAEDPQLQRQIAIKVIRPDLLQRSDARQRFLIEARAIAQVEHDHIIAIHAVHEERGIPYLVMPLLRGESLEDRLRRERGPLPVDDILRIGREIAAGLVAAHEKGLIHRDIKPANIFLTTETAEIAEPGAQQEKQPPDPTEVSPGSSSVALAPAPTISAVRSRVRILDFGLAQAVHQQENQPSQAGAIVGTPAYMAPEQARGLNVDGRADLFSLGCVMYRMATGQSPFQAKDMMSLLIQIAVDQPPTPRSINPGLPLALEKLILRLLEKKPEDRPASAQEVVAALAAIEEARRPKAKLWPWLVGMAAVMAFAIAWPIIFPAPPPPPPEPEPPGVVTFEMDEPEHQQLVIRRGDDPEQTIDLKKPGKHKLEAGTYTVRTAKASKPRTLTPHQFTLKPGETRTIPLQLLGEVRQDPNHNRTIWSIAAAGQGKDLLVLAAENDHTIGLWKAGTDEKSTFVDEEHQSPVLSVALTPDGKIAASGGGGRGKNSDHVIRIWDAPRMWDARKEAVTGRLRGHEGWVRALSLSRDGKHLVSGDSYGVLICWDVPSEKLLKRLEGHNGLDVHGVAISTDGKRALSAGADKQVLLWDINMGAVLKKLTDHTEAVRCVAIAPSGELAASGSMDGTIRLWDLKTGGSRVIDIDKDKVRKDGVYSLAFSPDGKRLLSGGGDGFVRLWDVASGRGIHAFKAHAATVYGVTFVERGRRAVSGGTDKTLRLWELPK